MQLFSSASRLPRIRTRRSAVAAVGSALAIAGLSLAAPASADPVDQSHAPFAYCPVDYVNSSGQPLATCVSSVGTGGTFTLGKTVVTLSAGTVFQGGLSASSAGLAFVPALDGMTLAAPAQPIPGGLLGVAQLQNLLPGVTDVQALVELAGTPDFSLGQNIDVTLPIQVKLQNSLLGKDCTIGSPADPIVLHLTTGTTTPPAGITPITGAAGTVSVAPFDASVLEFTDQTLVDNGFAVPGATGCGPLGLLNSLVNAKSGLPSAAGSNLGSLVSHSFLVAASDVDQVTGYTPGM